MPFIIQALGWLIATFIPALMKKIVSLGSNKLLVIAYLASLAAITVVFYQAINGTFSGLTNSLPADSYFLAGLRLVPSASKDCVVAISVGHAARWLYLWQAVYIRSVLASSKD